MNMHHVLQSAKAVLKDNDVCSENHRCFIYKRIRMADSRRMASEDRQEVTETTSWIPALAIRP